MTSPQNATSSHRYVFRLLFLVEKSRVISVLSERSSSTRFSPFFFEREII